MISSPSVYDFKPQRIQLINRYEYVKENSHWLEKLYKLIDKITASNDKKRENYSLKNIDLLGHLSFDLLVWRNEVISFCGVYSGGRYPKGAFRVLNRCYVVPEFRSKEIGGFSALNSQYLLREQLADFASDIEFPFISREGHLGYYFLKKWAEQYSPGKSWQVSDDVIHLVPTSSEFSAYQYICYPHKSSHLQNFKKISPSDWRALDAN